MDNLDALAGDLGNYQNVTAIMYFNTWMVEEITFNI